MKPHILLIILVSYTVVVTIALYFAVASGVEKNLETPTRHTAEVVETDNESGWSVTNDLAPHTQDVTVRVITDPCGRRYLWVSSGVVIPVPPNAPEIRK